MANKCLKTEDRAINLHVTVTVGMRERIIQLAEAERTTVSALVREGMQKILTEREKAGVGDPF